MTMQKIVSFLLITLALSANLYAQDVEYKKGMIVVDGNEYAKVEVKKQNFGLTKSFEVFNLAGQKIIIAAVATEFESDKNDNSYLFYRLTFLTAGQVGIFKIPSLSQEKGFAKLIGNSGILVRDTVNAAKLMEFIASKSATPSIAVDYTMVDRNRAWPVSLTKDRQVEQFGKIIGTFEPKGSSGEMDYYDFKLPSGVTVAKVSFTGGNNAQNMELFTAKDNYKRAVPIPQKEKIIIADGSIDKNQFTLKRVAKWLVDNQYL
jgi:hypothetical protein